MKRWSAIRKQLLAVFLLSVAALFGSGWASLYCHHFGSPFWAEIDAVLARFQVIDGLVHGERSVDLAEGYGEWLDSFVPLYWLWTGIAFLWIIAMGVYFWRTRNSLTGLTLGVLPLALFAYGSVENLRMAWPACNAF